ncbi:MAG TPA: S41 family peptidase [Patescibacteria group bacterium]|nr:S41 family peptidase [Patescibacteria group bacterium]
MAGIRLRVAGVLAIVALLACSTTAPTGQPSAGPAATATQPGSTSTPAPSPTADRNAGWRADLQALVPGMAQLHPNLTHGTSRAALDGAVADLIAGIPGSTDDDLMVGALRVVAMVSARGCDAHTGAFIWGAGTYPVESLPLRLWLFPGELGDSLVIVDALPPYEDLIGSTIARIEDQPEGDVRMQLRPIVPRDNDSTFRLLAPRYLLIPQVLRGLHVADDGPVTLGLTMPDGASRTVDVQPIPMADYNAWAGAYGLHLPADPQVLYLSRIDDALWWTRLQDTGTLFVQWNRVDHLPLGTVRDLRDELHKSDVTRVVLDVRHNYGGEVSAVDPMLELFTDPAIDQPGRLFVITGRNTFSAASLFVARLVRDTDAVVVGEPMGGCPTSYGNSRDMTLPFSGIAVSVATLLEVGVAADDSRPTIEPDVVSLLTAENWANGSDPALGMITTLVP